MVNQKAVWFAFSSAALALAELAVAVSAEFQQEVPCTDNLICNHEAACVKGVANFTVHMGMPNNTDLQEFIDTTPPDFLAVSQIDNQHCFCPMGWTGVTCEVKFESCDQTHPCFHGGQCILGLNDRYGNEQLFCNCDNAVDQEGNKYGTWLLTTITLFFDFDFDLQSLQLILEEI
jgi:hypothetical protein